MATLNLSDATAALIMQAESDQAAAAAADANEQQATVQLLQAQAAEQQTSQAQLAAHQTARASAWTALQALAKDFGVPIASPSFGGEGSDSLAAGAGTNVTLAAASSH